MHGLGARSGESAWCGALVELFSVGILSEAAAQRGIPTLCPQGGAGELRTLDGWRALFQLLDAVRADPTSSKDAFLAGGGEDELLFSPFWTLLTVSGSDSASSSSSTSGTA